ncbi:MAG: PASTA domain-containing protein, partial [Spirochaetes bacterium]|nr:PASTA domain-containing protein [Spirochaetota bacterium]
MELDNNNPDCEKEHGNNAEYNIFTLKNITRLSIIIFIGLSLYLFISTIVIIFLTKPNKETTVPLVTGKQFISVYNSIVRKGLKPEIKFLDVIDIDNGMILNQYPESGSIVPEGSKLTVTVSRSKAYVSVPNLIG